MLYLGYTSANIPLSE